MSYSLGSWGGGGGRGINTMVFSYSVHTCCCWKEPPRACQGHPLLEFQSKSNRILISSVMNTL